MSVYQIMCYNETSDMRRTFPQLFEQLDFARGNRQTRARHRSPPKSRSSNYVINDSSIAQQNGDKTNRKSASKRTSSLNASYIVKSQMDFTKTNPIAEDSTPGLKQRSRCPKKPHTLQIIMVWPDWSVRRSQYSMSYSLLQEHWSILSDIVISICSTFVNI